MQNAPYVAYLCCSCCHTRILPQLRKIYGSCPLRSPCQQHASVNFASIESGTVSPAQPRSAFRRETAARGEAAPARWSLDRVPLLFAGQPEGTQASRDTRRYPARRTYAGGPRPQRMAKTEFRGRVVSRSAISRNIADLERAEIVSWFTSQRPLVSDNGYQEMEKLSRPRPQSVLNPD